MTALKYLDGLLGAVLREEDHQPRQLLDLHLLHYLPSEVCGLFAEEEDLY